MKKAKIMLTAVAVFAIAGGVLALQARTNGANVYQAGDNNICSVLIPYSTEAQLFGNTTISGNYTTDPTATTTTCDVTTLTVTTVAD